MDIRPAQRSHLRSERAAALVAGQRTQGPLVRSDGPGFGGPAVGGGRVYLLDRDENVGDKLRVLDLANGKELWSFAYDALGAFMFAGSRTTPTLDGDLVYTVGPMGDLYAISIKTQKPVWQKNIWKDFGGDAELPRWAIVQNPLVYGDSLIVAPQTPKAGVVAYDKSQRQAEVAVAGAVRYDWLCDALDCQSGWRRPSGHGDRVHWTRTDGSRRECQRRGPADWKDPVDLRRLAVPDPGSASGRRRRGTAAHHGRV
jgi:PQQ-like domain